MKTITWQQKLNPLFWVGNIDEPKAPAWFEPEWSERKRNFYWLYIRNPFHNLGFYSLGVADKVENGLLKREGQYPQHVFNPTGQGCNFTYFLTTITFGSSLRTILLLIPVVLYIAKIIEFSFVENIIICLYIFLNLLLDYLPCVSYIGKYKFYLGWREKGNFGVKFIKNKDYVHRGK